MPFRRELYPEDWEAIVAVVRARAGEKCERCGAVNGERGAFHPEKGAWLSLERWESLYVSEYGHEAGRDELPSWWPRRFSRVVLTTAHQDHAAGPCRCEAATGRKCGNLDHLQSLCQRCHLWLDLPKHVANAAATRRRKALARQPELFAEVVP